jgi:hypothetical protein
MGAVDWEVMQVRPLTHKRLPEEALLRGLIPLLEISTLFLSR